MIPALTHGAFSWSELMTSDPGAATEFYGSILPWSSQLMPMPTGDYHVQMIGGVPVAGVMALPHEPMPSVWAYYITVNDVDAILERAVALGAKVEFQPIDVPNVGRMAGFLDPQGAYVSVITYEPMAEDAPHPGADFTQSFGTPGAFSWFSLQTTDVEGACAFYSEVFGWEFRVDTMGMGPYHVILVDGTGIGGVIPVMQEGVPPHWSSYITVEDADQTAASAAAAGGTVIVPPMDIPTVGRFALIQDPTGAMINVMKYMPMGPST